MRNLLLPLALLTATPALAHHPMGGEAPQTVVHGLLSGLAHPVIGLDHLAFVVLVGLASAASGRLLAGPLAFVFATMAGTLVQVGGLRLPASELVIAGSVVLLGALLLLGRRMSGQAALAGFAGAGLFHGWAYGEAVLGSKMAPVTAYLAGFCLIQFGIAAGVALVAAKAGATADRAQATGARLTAAIACGIGLASLAAEAERLIVG